VLHQAQLMEQGTHAELMARDGIYKSLMNSQENKKEEHSNVEDKDKEIKNEDLVVSTEPSTKETDSNTIAIPTNENNISSEDYPETESESESIRSIWSLTNKLIEINKDHYYLLVIGIVASSLRGIASAGSG